MQVRMTSTQAHWYNQGYLDNFFLFFLLAAPSQDVFLLPHIPYIGQGGSILLVHYSMIIYLDNCLLHLRRSLSGENLFEQSLNGRKEERQTLKNDFVKINATFSRRLERSMLLMMMMISEMMRKMRRVQFNKNWIYRDNFRWYETPYGYYMISVHM